jgi:hypothetical protein
MRMGDLSSGVVYGNLKRQAEAPVRPKLGPWTKVASPPNNSGTLWQT